LDTEHQRSIVRSLATKYPVFAVSTIERWVAETIESFGSARITKYLPILVQRSVDATLTELARSDGTSTDLLSISKLTEPGRTLALPEITFWPASKSVQNRFG
jgi:phage terminase Nu1 subunit (DNA packaging protein)